jgi:phosphoglycerate dehydrogenase-like enzyme
MMKNTAILVNSSRGQEVHQKALYEALGSGRSQAPAWTRRIPSL